MNSLKSSMLSATTQIVKEAVDIGSWTTDDEMTRDEGDATGEKGEGREEEGEN